MFSEISLNIKKIITAQRAYKIIKQLITAKRAYKIIKKMWDYLPPFETAIGHYESTVRLQPAIAAL